MESSLSIPPSFPVAFLAQHTPRRSSFHDLTPKALGTTPQLTLSFCKPVRPHNSRKLSLIRVLDPEAMVTSDTAECNSGTKRSARLRCLQPQDGSCNTNRSRPRRRRGFSTSQGNRSLGTAVPTFACSKKPVFQPSVSPTERNITLLKRSLQNTDREVPS